VIERNLSGFEQICSEPGVGVEQKCSKPEKLKYTVFPEV